ncbi:hypothetical protein DENSPDRAFT_833073 [Dentipellis sp. KUC8613]|nr:hypothetical protein DENSPDRAFT_833073 [Dentipellis sp. KUC8613]
MADSRESKLRSRGPSGRLTFRQRLAALTWRPFQLLGNAFLAGARPATPPVVSFSILLIVTPILFLISLVSGIYVWRNIAIGWEAPIYLQYGDGLPPYAEVALPPISAVHPYDISLGLVVPTTEANFALGNFMVTLTLATPSNRTLTALRRPAIVLPEKPSVVRFLSGRPSTTSLKIPLLSAYVSGTSSVVARVELGRRDGWKSLGHGEGRELSVLSASVVGTLIHRGIRGIISRYPVFSGLISAGAFLVISFIFLVVQIFLIPSLQWKASRMGLEVPTSPGFLEDSEDKKPIKEVSEERQARRRRLSKGSRTRKVKIESDLDADAPASQIPSPDTSEISLRRRRSGVWSDSE